MKRIWAEIWGLFPHDGQICFYLYGRTAIYTFNLQKFEVQ